MRKNMETQLLLSLLTLQGRIGKRMGNSLSMHGISLTEYLVLQCLSQAPEHRLRRIDLADSIGVTASGVTRLLNPMEKIGLVRKEATERDARVSLVALSTAGEQLLADATVTFAEAASRICRGLQPAETAELTRLLDRVS